LAEYLDAVRDVERRIQKAEEQSTKELPLVTQPVGIPTNFEEHAKLMFDLALLSFQTDLTRVFTYVMVRESSIRSYPRSASPIPITRSHTIRTTRKSSPNWRS